jgi:hypothetical protein
VLGSIWPDHAVTRNGNCIDQETSAVTLRPTISVARANRQTCPSVEGGANASARGSGWTAVTGSVSVRDAASFTAGGTVVPAIAGAVQGREL